MLSLFQPDIPVFTREQTHGLLWRPEQKILASSDPLGWTTVYASAQREAPYEDSYTGVNDHLLIVHLDGPVEVSRRLLGAEANRVVPPGGMFLMPANHDFGVRLAAPLSTLHVYVRNRTLDRMAQEIYGGAAERAELLPRFGEHDELIQSLARSLKECLEAPHAADRLMAEALATTLAARLLRRHSNLSDQSPSPVSGALSDARLTRVYDYVEAHLDEPITVEAMARVAGLGPVHFARAFRNAVGMPPHRYVVEARVRRAKHALEQPEASLAEVALACGFCHQEHLTHVFKKVVGVTPGAYRRARMS
jgi:AraC family transcriptional regulator